VLDGELQSIIKASNIAKICPWLKKIWICSDNEKAIEIIK
jgi:hypothetical protein